MRRSQSLLSVIGRILMIRIVASSSRIISGFVGSSDIRCSRPSRTVASMSSSSAPVSATDCRIIHLNHAGASPSPPSVFNRVLQHMKLEQKVGGYAAAQQVQDELQDARRTIARLIGADNPDEIALVESATVAWTRLFYSMVEYQDRMKMDKTKIILVSEAEYAANVVACCQWAKDHVGKWTVLPIPSRRDEENRSTGIIDLEIFQDMLQGRFVIESETTSRVMDPSAIAMVCVTHVPTNSGIVNPVAEIGAMIEVHNQEWTQRDVSSMPPILYLVDACQSVGQFPVDAVAMRCHGLTATGRKYLRAPRGTGFLLVPLHVCEHLRPSHMDHYCAPVVAIPSKKDSLSGGLEHSIEYTFRDGAGRFEFWESNVANKLGLAEAARYALDTIGVDTIGNKCSELASDLRSRLQAMDSVNVHHKESTCGIVTFSILGVVDVDEVKRLLWLGDESDLKFEVSVVPATSTPIDSAQSQVPNLLRASMSYTNTRDELDAFCGRLQHIIKLQNVS